MVRCVKVFQGVADVQSGVGGELGDGLTHCDCGKADGIEVGVIIQGGLEVFKDGLFAKCVAG